MTTIDRILSPDNLDSALRNLVENPDARDDDDGALSQLRDYLETNRDSLVESIKSGRFQPSVAQESGSTSSSKKARKSVRLSPIDRLVLRAIFQVLFEEFEPTFSDSSFGVNPDLGVADAVKRASEIIEGGARFAVSVALEDFFETIPCAKLVDLLSRRGIDETTTRLIDRYFVCEIFRGVQTARRRSGALKGIPLDALLISLYLREADVYFENRDWPFCRCGAEVRLFAKSEREGYAIFQSARFFLENVLYLKIRQNQSGVGSAFDGAFLGYRFYETSAGKIECRREDRADRERSQTWRKSSLQKVGADFHVVADGILGPKDYALLFENPTKQIHLPVRDTESLNLYSKIGLGVDFFQSVADHKIVVNFFDPSGEYLGAFIPQGLDASSSLVLQQASAYLDPKRRLELASQFARGAAHNLRENLRYYARHIESQPLKDAIDDIGELMNQERLAPTIDALMLLEGRIRETYYSQFAAILPRGDFVFDKRTRRPPLNPLNALLSYGNAILYRRVAREIYKSRLDIRFGYLHATNARRESLNLDVAELFRPVVVERVVFSLVNKRVLSVARDFEERSDGAVYLNEGGKKTFINALEGKLATKTRQKSGEASSYSALIREEIRKLTRYFENGEEYKPYKYFL